MADELFRVRRDFVERVSENMIVQLADDLLQDKIVNDGESRSILDGKRAAHDLIDTVRKKGDEASWKMIAHLKRRDPTLSRLLGLMPQQAQAEAVMSDTVIPSTVAFWMEKTIEGEIYPVTKESMKSRVALLISNINFSDGFNYRRGGEKDHENMNKLLQELGYEVVKYTNITAQGMENALEDFSRHPKLRKTDSVFVVLMSRGMRDHVLGVADDAFPIDRIFKHLGSRRCPNLVGKPKIIIIQACRGDNVSYRHTSQGSILIQYIVTVFNNYAHKEDIRQLFQRVTRRVEEEFLFRRQIPTIERCSMMRDFYLFPGLSSL